MVDKRAAKTAWRERKADWAVVAVHIGKAVWVKLTPTPEALENRLGFMLRQGGAGLPREMAAAVRDGGSLRLEVVERLDPKLSDLARERVGEERLDHWRETLGAATF